VVIQPAAAVASMRPSDSSSDTPMFCTPMPAMLIATKKSMQATSAKLKKASTGCPFTGPAGPTGRTGRTGSPAACGAGATT
jgi:hypothetical protein